MLLAWRQWLVFMQAYTLATGAFLAWSGLPDDVHALWSVGSSTAALTITAFQGSPARISYAWYWGAMGVVLGITGAGFHATNALLHHNVLLWPRLAIAVLIGTVAVAAAVTFIHLGTPQRPRTDRETEPSGLA